MNRSSTIAERERPTTIVAFVVLWALTAVPSVSAAPVLRVTFANDRVTIVALDVLASDVLGEWGRAGGTEIRGAALLGARRVSLEVDSVDESDALARVVGSSFGTIAALKSGAGGGSRFARIIVTRTAEQPRARSTDDPPEARYRYTAPSDAASTGEIALSGLPSAARELPDPAGVPEAIFEYSEPSKSKPTELPVPGAFIQPEGHPIEPPEARFDYVTPSKAMRAKKTGAAKGSGS